MYYEHQAREHSKAAELTREALAAVRRALHACPERGPGVGWIDLSRWRKLQARLEHRLARLIRKSRHPRSEEHTSELQSRLHLVCRLLLEKKKKKNNTRNTK